MSVPAPIPQGELCHISAEALFLAAGFEAACGWPLPNGDLPVGGKGIGTEMWMIKEAEWMRYRALCDAERAAVLA